VFARITAQIQYGEDMSESRSKTNLGMDDLSEDMFGLSLRGLRTMWTVFASPKKIFEAARSPDWQSYRFTPSLRVVFSILAVITGLRFIWIGPDSALVQSTLLHLLETGAVSTEEEARAVTKTILDRYILIFPFAMMLIHFLAGTVLHIWGKGTSAVLRIRLYFTAVIPNTLLSLLLLMPLSTISIEEYSKYSLLVVLVTFSADLITALRGGVAGKAIWVRIGKALLFAITSLAVAIISNVIGFNLPVVFA
tara:strand:- start:70944 stop:71696 length:753 start_codon:yes stop_codon:yes gene_type:complete